MKKKICFPVTNRVHLSRQQLLLEELGKYFNVEIFEPANRGIGMSIDAIICGVQFHNYLQKIKPDAVLARGDRYEVLPLATAAIYNGIKTIHIEAGDLSGVVDNKVRHAITHLSDYHFPTNTEAHARLIKMGVPLDKVWNFGSLDTEYAMTVKPKRIIDEPYILVSYHPIEGENEKEVEQALGLISGYKIINIASNKDYGKSFGSEEYSPEDYINLIRFASCCVGNSSSFLKEASILGTPVVNIGSRQDKRLKPKNVIDVDCQAARIFSGIKFQLDNSVEPDNTYYQPGTSKNIAKILKQVL